MCTLAQILMSQDNVMVSCMSMDAWITNGDVVVELMPDWPIVIIEV